MLIKSEQEASVQEGSNSPYSHGLEKIYALEAVDIKTVRRIESPSRPVDEEPEQRPLEKVEQKPQYELNLGDQFQEASYPFKSRAWLKEMVSSLPPIEGYLSLQKHGLSDLISLTPRETVDLKRMSPEKKERLAEKALDDLRQTVEIGKQVQKIVDTFLVPWIRGRLGIASELELTERFQRVVDYPAFAPVLLDFLREVFCRKRFPFSDCLYQIDEHLYSSDSCFADKYYRIQEKTKTYFYGDAVHYRMSELVCWVSREFAKEWEGFSEGMVEKVIRYSPLFRVRKGFCGELVIRLA